MNVRRMKQSDVPVLRAMAEASGYPYPEPNATNLRGMRVVVDDQDYPLMASAAEPIWQAYLWCGRASTATERMAALRLLHDELPEALKGIGELNAFIPPGLAVQFGKRLERTFGWARNWPSWWKRF